MNSFDMTRYLTHASVGFLALTAYDSVLDGKSFYNYSLYDGGSFALASVLALWVKDLLSNVWGGLSGQSLQGMITQPLLTGIFYLYAFDMLVRPNNREIRNRSGTELFIMGSLGNILVGYIENPISSLFGYRVY